MDRILTAKFSELLAPMIEAIGFELWGLEVVGEGHTKLVRIYIDSPTGVTLDDCTKVSSQAGGILDVEDLIPSKYSLEVSSPGLDRLLFKKEHYQRYIGSEVKIKLERKVGGRKNVHGIIAGVEGDELLVKEEKGIVKIDINMVEKARLVYIT